MTALLITRRTLTDRRTSVIWWAVGILLYTGIIMAVWPVIDGNTEFQDLASSYPDAMKAMFGGADAFESFTTPAGFLNTYLFSMILPFILVGLAVSMGAALLAGEEEGGQLDLVLSYPVRRVTAVSQKALAMLLTLLVMGVLIDLVVYGAAQLVDLQIGLGDLAAATLGTVLFGAFSGLTALLAGAVVGRKGVALGVGWGVALGGYLLSILSTVDDSLDWLRWASPLAYATADDPLTNGAPAAYLVLFGAAMALFGATAVLFNRHDLS